MNKHLTFLQILIIITAEKTAQSLHNEDDLYAPNFLNTTLL